MRLEDAFSYNPETGEITRTVTTSSRAPKGRVVGSPNQNGYLGFYFSGRRYTCSRVAWYLYYGSWPEGDVDHLDNDRTNNRINNLEDVSHRVNCQRRSIRTKKKLPLGVRLHPRSGKYEAQASIGGRTKYLGTYRTPEQAHQRYLEFINESQNLDNP